MPRLSPRHFLVAAALLALGGCAYTPEDPASVAEISPPAAWQNAEKIADTAALSSEQLAAWWQQFNDPTLDQLIDTALQNSPDIQTALSRIAESRARRGVEKAALLPTLSGNLSAKESYNRDHNTHTTTSGDSYAAGLDASWEIDLFGKNRAALAAADADLRETEENFYYAQVSLAAEIATTYITLRSTEEQLAVVERTLATRTETTQLAQWTEEAGTGDALDAQQAVSTLEQARATIPALQRTIVQTRNQLCVLLGQTPGSLDASLSSGQKLPAAPARFAAALPVETLRQRPDIRAAEQAFFAAFQRTKAAELERLPTLNLSGSIGVEALRAGDLFSPDATIGSLLAGLTAPIFQGGRIDQNIAIQNEQQKQAALSYKGTVLTALSEVEDALIAVQKTADRITTLEKAATAAREADQLAGIRYEAGDIDISAVLDTQRTLLSLEEQLVAARADLLSAYVQLYKSLGGGWTPLAA